MAEKKQSKNDNVMFIDGNPVRIEGEKNLLALIRKTGVDMPTFCYNNDLSTFGACRMCMVEDDRGRLSTSCTTPPAPGMKIRTNTQRLRRYRKNILKLLLAEHCRDCTTCDKSGHCKLQSLSLQFGIDTVPFERTKKDDVEDDSSPCIVRNPGKCILCGDCVRECAEIQSVGAIDIAFRGSNARVSTCFGVPLSESACVGCGQCAAVCPTGAIVVHEQFESVWEFIDDPTVFVTCEIAPAVRAGIAKEFGTDGVTAFGRIVAALHRMGVDEVYDTSTGADLTTIEEANELVERLTTGEKLPLFTSCCPAWVRFAESQFPDMVPNLSTCRSPMSMFSAVVKDRFRDNLPEGKTRHIHFAVMPCTAKKFEVTRDEFKRDGLPATDFSISTQELVKMMRESGISFDQLAPEAIDSPFGTISGAGVIFGVTGGVTEAVLRKISEDSSRNAMSTIAFTGIRGFEGVKEASIVHGDREVRIAVVSGLANARKLIDAIKLGEKQYDIVEVMACPGGCINGAGQPFEGRGEREDLGEKLYDFDRVSSIRRPQDNPVVKELYATTLADHEKVHELLHVEYTAH